MKTVSLFNSHTLYLPLSAAVQLIKNIKSRSRMCLTDELLQGCMQIATEIQPDTDGLSQCSATFSFTPTAHPNLLKTHDGTPQNFASREGGMHANCNRNST
jgi:hypothetical protein